MTEGLVVWTYNNPSVSRADSSLYTREPENARQPTGIYRNDRVSSLPSLCKGRWRAKRAGRVAAYKYKP